MASTRMPARPRTIGSAPAAAGLLMTISLGDVPDVLRAPPLVVVDSIADHWLLFVAFAFEHKLARATPSATEYATDDDAPVVPKRSSELPALLDDQQRADMNAGRSLDGAGHDDLSPLADVHGSRLRA